MSLLYNDPPIAVSPTLASVFGLTEAAFLQQLHYWLEEKRRNAERYQDSFADGHFWVFDTAEDWIKKMPYLGSVSTFRRMIAELKKLGVITVSSHNKKGFDKTSWYRIDMDQLNAIVELKTRGGDTIDHVKMSRREYQNDKTRVSKRHDGEYQNDKTNTKDYTETTTETTANIKPARADLVPLPLDDFSDPEDEASQSIESQQPPLDLKLKSASGSEAGFPQPVDGFEQFWQLYPRHERKLDAVKAWKKLNTGQRTAAEADVRARLEARAWTQQDTRFVPHASTYLNGQRWQDDWRQTQTKQQSNHADEGRAHLWAVINGEA